MQVQILPRLSRDVKRELKNSEQKLKPSASSELSKDNFLILKGEQTRLAYEDGRVYEVRCADTETQAGH
jgi:hypothetical protein